MSLKTYKYFINIFLVRNKSTKNISSYTLVRIYCSSINKILFRLRNFIREKMQIKKFYSDNNSFLPLITPVNLKLHLSSSPVTCVAFLLCQKVFFLIRIHNYKKMRCHIINYLISITINR